MRRMVPARPEPDASLTRSAGRDAFLRRWSWDHHYDGGPSSGAGPAPCRTCGFTSGRPDATRYRRKDAAHDPKGRGRQTERLISGPQIAREPWPTEPCPGKGVVVALVSRVNYICRLASISFAGSPPGLDPSLLGSVGAVAGDVKLQDDGVMDHPVDCRGGGHGVGEDALPLREDQV